jgi:hypothetical protein
MMTEQGIYLHNLPYATVPANPSKKGRSAVKYPQRNAFQFVGLDAEHRKALRELIDHHV